MLGNIQQQTSIASTVIFSTEYAVPYHGSVLSVCPSNFVDIQKILSIENLFENKHSQKMEQVAKCITSHLQLMDMDTGQFRFN